MLIEKKIIIFDLDGVLINSIKNMEMAWLKTCKKFNLKANFKDYKKYLGLPFFQILKKLNIRKNHQLIKKNYDNFSNKNINLVKIYPNVKKVLNILYRKDFLTAVITSKDKKRTKKIISKFGLYFNYVYSPSKKYNSKPHPEQILKIISKEKINEKNCFYVGDMNLDAQFARRAGVNFIFAAYGYETKKRKYRNTIKNLNQLIKYFNG